MSKRREFGNVNKMASGRFRARYRMYGEWRSAPHTFASEVDADAWLSEIAGQLQRREWSADKGGSLTFKEWADRWVELPRRRRKRTDAGVSSVKAPRTVAEYKSVLKLHVIPFLGSTPMDHIDLRRAMQFMADLENKLEENPCTLAKATNYASWVMNFAVRKGAIAFNPFLDEEIVMPAGARKREPLELEPYDIERLAEGIDSHFALVPMLAGYAGLRAGEVWALRRRSLNVLRKELLVSESVADVVGKGLILGPPKNGYARRIALPEFVFDLVEQHLEAQPGKPEDWLFRSKHRGHQVRHSNFMADFWRPAKLAAEVPTGMRFHDLRHYCAHYHISAGFELADIKELLGHRSITVTGDIYGGLFNSRRREMADKVHALYSASRTSGVTRPGSLSSIETG